MGCCHGDSRHHIRKHIILGGALLVAGVVALLSGQGIISHVSAWLVAPIIIGVSGLVRLMFARHIGQAIRGVLHLLLAAWLLVCIEQFWGWTFHSTWPVLLILVGAASLTRGAFGRCRHSRPEVTP